MAESRTAAEVHVVAKDGKVSTDVGSGQGTAKVYLVGYCPALCL
jgi:hypothetical protein